eukprot:12480905-Alexandrium_andersonii.AAC.1
MALRPLVAQGALNAEKEGEGSSEHRTSSVEFDTYFKLCVSAPNASTQFFRTFIPELISETSDASSTSATSPHVLGLRPGTPLLFGTSRGSS